MGEELFSAAQPIGCRCTCNIGSERDSDDVNCWDLSQHDLAQEMEAFHGNHLDPQLSETEHRDAFARLKSLIIKARQGRLEFSGASPDAKVMERAQFVIELRPMPERTMRFGQPHLPARLVRLYCAEPRIVENTILGLHLGTKPNAGDLLREQNASIDTAAQRAHDWEMSQYTQQTSRETGGNDV